MIEMRAASRQRLRASRLASTRLMMSAGTTSF
jgi:hypothetical protein